MSAPLVSAKELGVTLGGHPVLRGVDIIRRGYEQLADRLIELGAQIETFHD